MHLRKIMQIIEEFIWCVRVCVKRTKEFGLFRFLSNAVDSMEICKWFDFFHFLSLSLSLLLSLSLPLSLFLALDSCVRNV